MLSCPLHTPACGWLPWPASWTQAWPPSPAFLGIQPNVHQQPARRAHGPGPWLSRQWRLRCLAQAPGPGPVPCPQPPPAPHRPAPALCPAPPAAAHRSQHPFQGCPSALSSPQVFLPEDYGAGRAAQSEGAGASPPRSPHSPRRGARACLGTRGEGQGCRPSRPFVRAAQPRPGLALLGRDRQFRPGGASLWPHRAPGPWPWPAPGPRLPVTVAFSSRGAQAQGTQDEGASSPRSGRRAPCRKFYGSQSRREDRAPLLPADHLLHVGRDPP